MLRTLEIQLALRECLRTAPAERGENLAGIVGGLAECVAGFQRQLMPELVRTEFKLSAVIVRIGRVGTPPDDA